MLGYSRAGKEMLDKFRNLFLILFMVLATPVAASDGLKLLEVPDFAEFPAAEVRHLDHDVHQALRDAYDVSARIDRYMCETRIDILLDVYVERWPQFAQWIDDPDWRRYWADHFGKTVYRSEIGCHFVNPIRAVLNAEDSHHSDEDRALLIPRWCGRWRDGGPVIKEDHAVAALIELAFEDVIPDAAVALYGQSQSHFRSFGTYVAMNPDVMMLLIERSKVMAERRNFIFPLRLNEEEQRYAMLHMVSDARRKEVEAAARSGDWRSILETTGPCRNRDVVMEEAGLPPREY